MAERFNHGEKTKILFQYFLEKTVFEEMEKKSGGALTQLPLTLHYSRKIFY